MIPLLLFCFQLKGCLISPSLNDSSAIYNSKFLFSHLCVLDPNSLLHLLSCVYSQLPLTQDLFLWLRDSWSCLHVKITCQVKKQKQNQKQQCIDSIQILCFTWSGAFSYNARPLQEPNSNFISKCSIQLSLMCFFALENHFFWIMTTFLTMQ